MLPSGAVGSGAGTKEPFLRGRDHARFFLLLARARAAPPVLLLLFLLVRFLTRAVRRRNAEHAWRQHREDAPRGLPLRGADPDLQHLWLRDGPFRRLRRLAWRSAHAIAAHTCAT
eukprot:657642-Rhodomonas_salina.1